MAPSKVSGTLITADQLLSGFDIQDDQSRAILRQAIASGQSPARAINELQDIALARDDEEAAMALQHAEAIGHQGKETEKTKELSKKKAAKHTSHFWDGGEDVSDAASTAGSVQTSSSKPFAEFDKLANRLREELSGSGSGDAPVRPALAFERFDRLAQRLRDDLEVSSKALTVSKPALGAVSPAPSRSLRGRTPLVARQTPIPCPTVPGNASGNGQPYDCGPHSHCYPVPPPDDASQSHDLAHTPHPEFAPPLHPELASHLHPEPSDSEFAPPPPLPRPHKPSPPRHHRIIRTERAVKATSKTKTSPFFSTTSPDPPILPPPPAGDIQEVIQEDQKGAPLSKSPRKPPPGTVSSLPIPPLSAPNFGLIQEELANSPFHLLVAVTFLIKTAGRTAIPVFRRLISRFPTPEEVAREENKGEVINLIKPLGLAEHRYGIMLKLARGFLEDPPTKERRYGVRNYSLMGEGRDVTAGEVFGAEDNSNANLNVGDMVTDRKKRAIGQAWEIGHLTQGAYTLDSWRIFCRDVLLGRAEDWTGRGGHGGEGFQPEWMRVLPKDKELRACLRWMWMREGWEWDPITGDREPLREELQKAVDEGRVAYDDNGNLVILGSEEVTEQAAV